MSDDDSLIFDDGNESPSSPEPVKKKPVAKKAAGPKKPTATKKATTAKTTKTIPKKRSVASDDDGSDGDLASTPPSTKKQKKAPGPKKATSKAKPLQPKENESEVDGDDFGEPSGASKAEEKKSSGDAYQKLTQLEHILKRPDTYIGSVERTEKQMWVFNSVTNSMEWKTVNMVPGLYKIFDEILVNAADNKIRDPKMDTLKVTVDKTTNTVSVFNNGRGIPIEMHSKEKVYVPELIFGHLLTSSNYDDDQKKVTGGRNGYGAKLCNIFSTEFTLETADKESKQKYKQTWTDNMGKMGKAKITANPKGEEFTRITFKPDLAKFQMEEMDDDLEAIIKRRVYDLAGAVKGVKVYLNGERINLNFKKYCEMYINALHEENGGEDKPQIIHETINDRWEIGFAVSNGSFQQVSFVNSIATTSGGTHVNAIADQIGAKLMEMIKKKNKTGAAVKNAQIRNHFFIFVNCLVENPAFTSQTKEQLTTKPSAFGSKCPVSEGFIKSVSKTEVVQNILDFANMKADKALKKTDGSRRSRINNPKLIDANKAGTKDGHECVLILTEGDSAKTLAVAGVSAIDGRDRYGVFPLRGKLLNVRDATHDQIMKNTEIQNIKQILGLQHKKVYESRKDLRYGHLMIMTDQDHDGSHIKGLLINFLETQFPSLLKLPHFLIEFITPIVKVYKGPLKKPTKQLTFFTMPEYEYWKENNTEKGWEHKYYKGLGSSGEEEAKVYFADLERHMKEFHIMEEEGRHLIEMAFSKKKADERKEWLRLYKPGTFLDHRVDKISYTEFVNKELILFSMADNIRSIPSIVDGLKPGQRKILFSCFKRNLRKGVKVSELSGYVSEQSAYHHGEPSLQGAIINMAQTFVGSNNLNLLEPEGSFGTRLDGGKDAASPRYITTLMSAFARKLFPAMDDSLLTYNLDDTKKIEPTWYAPIVPLVLINGADGIGTGWSTNIPNYNPEDVVDNIRRLMRNEELEPMVPWYRNWTGTVEKLSDDKFKFTGTVKQIDDVTCEVTELPVKMWTQEFKEKLEEIIKAEKAPSFIKDYIDYNSPQKVHFIITMESAKHMQEALAEGLENKFKLSKTIATTNLVAFDPEGRINKYNTVSDILKEFYFVRLKLYSERKEYMLNDMNRTLLKLTNQARFIKMIVDKELVVSNRKRADIIAELKKKNFDTFSKKEEAKKADEDEDAEEEEDTQVGDGYNYLLGMAIWSLTKEKVDKLLQEVANKELEIDELLKLSPKQLWSTDLDAFIEEWRHTLEEDKRLAAEGTVKKKRGGKLFAKGAKGKKKAGSDDSDYEAKKKKPTAKADAKKQSTLGFKPTEAEKVDKKPARAAKKETPFIEELSDDDFEMLEQNVAKARPAAAAKPEPERAPSMELLSSSPAAAEKIGALSKRTDVYKPESDDDDDDDGGIFVDAVASKAPTGKNLRAESEDGFEDSEAEKPKPKKAPLKKTATTTKAPTKSKVTAKPAAKPKVAAKIFDDDSDDDELPPPPPPRAAASKPKRAAAAKKSIMDMETDSDDDGLGDVSAMVKGVGGGGAAAVKLFKESPAKPKGSTKITVTKKIATKPAPKKAPITLDSDNDDDDGSNGVKKNGNMLPSDSEEDLLPLKPVAKPTKRAAPAKPAPSKRTAPAKKAPTKPAAKGRGKKIIEESDDELDVDSMADKLLDSDEDIEMEDPKPKKAASKEPEARPASRGRAARGAASKVASYKITGDSDDDDDDDDASEDFDDDSE